ncbi:hypothetical protein AALO_G00143190 [Alosa alosa]|uniref:Uncharacterized protein n=1 Tax=Alosa alosa TaxID=278164 RepID=A0AAV6GN82_9TELE|nr:hypothetical protein AALO_G00143190 [Alosa alosa]
MIPMKKPEGSLPSSKYVGFRSTSAPPPAASGRPPVQASTSRLHTETMERPKKKFCNNFHHQHQRQSQI